LAMVRLPVVAVADAAARKPIWADATLPHVTSIIATIIATNHGWAGRRRIDRVAPITGWLTVRCMSSLAADRPNRCAQCQREQEGCQFAIVPGTRRCLSNIRVKTAVAIGSGLAQTPLTVGSSARSGTSGQELPTVRIGIGLTILKSLRCQRRDWDKAGWERRSGAKRGAMITRLGWCEGRMGETPPFRGRRRS
jgi:hypothetical protein